jgi:hypothetical protein
VNPGLHINGLGTVGLPLSVRDAQAIAFICKKSPFGRGDQTLIDECVRKTWELDASEVQLLNPEWITFLDQILVESVSALGVRVSTRAEP